VQCTSDSDSDFDTHHQSAPNYFCRYTHRVFLLENLLSFTRLRYRYRTDKCALQTDTSCIYIYILLFRQRSNLLSSSPRGTYNIYTIYIVTYIMYNEWNSIYDGCTSIIILRTARSCAHVRTILLLCHRYLLQTRCR